MAEQLLLKTKLSPPLHGGHFVHRKRLIESLSESPDACMILISAPAGYGKTTAMCDIRQHWLENDRSTAWVSLDSGDNDPVRFATYLMAAFNHALPALFPGGSRPINHLESTIIHVVNSLIEAGVPCSLILDDYHLITNQVIHSAINLLMDNLPAGFRLMIGSRGDPPLQLSRLRVRQRLVELRAADLRFTLDEVSDFCATALDIRPSKHSAQLLEASTEGWAAGLQLASVLISQRHPAPDDEAIAALARQVSGTDRAIFDYLAEEVLNHQPPDIQRFLMWTSILSQFNADLCISLVGNGSHTLWLHSVERADLFIMPVGEEAGWYRYHHLFAHFLQTRLAETEPHQVSVLHKAAAQWFAAHGNINEAIEHALAGSDYSLAAALFTENAWESLMARGHLITLLRWVQAFPEQSFMENPRLALFASQVLMQVGQNQASLKLVACAEQTLDRAALQDEQSAQDRGVLAANQALRAMSTGYPMTALDFSKRAAALIGPEDRLTAIQIARTNGFIHYNLGNMQAAVDAAQTAMDLSRQMDQHYWRLESAHWLALSYIKMGDLRTADALCRELETAYATDFGPLACVLGPRGIVATEWNHLADAEALFRRSIEMSRRERLMDALWIACIGLARVYLFRGQMEPIAALLEEGLWAAEALGSAVILSIARTVHARAALARGDLRQAQNWAESYLAQRPGEYPAELEDLTLARVWLALGRTTDALNLLDSLYEPARSARRFARVIEAQILRAVVLENSGQTDQADAALDEALALGEPQSYLRTFIDHAGLLAQPLQRAEVRHPAYVGRIMQAAQQTRNEGAIVEALTEREVEVLRLLARGAANQEIAETLVIGLGTVKSHVNHIMSKLNAHNRTEAVALARTQSLLD